MIVEDDFPDFRVRAWLLSLAYRIEDHWPKFIAELLDGFFERRHRSDEATERDLDVVDIGANEVEAVNDSSEGDVHDGESVIHLRFNAKKIRLCQWSEVFD